MTVTQLKATDFTYRRRPYIFTDLVWSAWLFLPASLRLTAYRALWKLSKIIGYGATSSLSVRRLVLFNVYAKQGRWATVKEALATQYVWENTSIPVPRVLDVISLGKGKGNFLLLKGMKGREYGPTGITLDIMPKQQRVVFTETLKGWFQQLRSLTPPDDHKISGFMGAEVFSHRISHSDGVGTFKSQDEFHAQKFCTPWEPYDDNLRAALEKRAMTRYRICFTHGDITPFNILVDDDIRPCALIDWECAAWMPEYWEYTRCLYLRERYVEWKELFTQIFPGYEDELAVERAIWDHHTP
ncbi:hypothetical protein CVT26_001268 [Gymnopilus dilepis]|uniref:Aminoglycoside phosphotransferase domain-containing protein n=1 Tax=Gymnopilus dilepis TaxID=231916 RepID=A0A409Y203_9AGAR|nr:hypothetical protein CVT26_001268 [Gymnopilus dilepis]